jgi:hypothetical protein
MRGILVWEGVLAFVALVRFWLRAYDRTKQGLDGT